MKTAVIGSGAREHALIEAMRRTSEVSSSLFCLGTTNNPGIGDITSGYAIGDITDAVFVTSQLTAWNIDLAVIGPEAPLNSGVPDALRAAGIAVFGPDRDLARIETSKSYTRELLQSAAPEASPRFALVSSINEAERVLASLGDAYVIKADGLAGGKGVKVSGDHLHSRKEALGYVNILLEADGRCLIEEKLIGQEFSLFTVTDGSSCCHLPPVQDHKRLLEGDKGPNTGGMGSYTDADHLLPFLAASDIERAAALNEQVIEALERDNGRPYRGVLYGGFMAVAEGVRVIEFNARFGDPEVMNLMAVADTDVTGLLDAAARGTLASCRPMFLRRATVCKYLVPDGYPQHSTSGEVITIGNMPENCSLHYGSVNLQGDRLVTGGSRTAACTASAATIEEAAALVEQALSSINGNLCHRRDIGTKELLNARIDSMNELRS